MILMFFPLVLMIPTRLLAGRPELLVSEVDGWFEKLKPIEDNAALNFANALLNLLWAYELRATASWVFQLAIKRGIFSRDVFRSVLYTYVHEWC